MSWLNANDTFLMDILARARLDELLASADVTLTASEADEPPAAARRRQQPQYVPHLLGARACPGLCA